MSVDDDFDYDEEEDEAAGTQSGEDLAGSEKPSSGEGLRDWLNARRGWMIIIALAIGQGLFATIMIMLRSNARPVRQIQLQQVQDLAVEMLGHEVAIRQIYQTIPVRGGRRMTIGLDLVLVLGQLPEERIEGAPRPNAKEMDMFVATIQELEPRIRSRVNELLQQIPAGEYGSIEVYKKIKESVRNYLNDTLDGFDFGKNLRPGIGKRRVTDVLLPMFVRQML